MTCCGSSLVCHKEYQSMKIKKDRDRKTKLDILNQTRDRTPMPRPAVFRDKKKYDRNVLKNEDRKEN